MTASSDAVTRLVGPVAAYVTPAPAAPRASGGGRSQGANAQRKRAAREAAPSGPRRGADPGPFGSSGTRTARAQDRSGQSRQGQTRQGQARAGQQSSRTGSSTSYSTSHVGWRLDAVAAVASLADRGAPSARGA